MASCGIDPVPVRPNIVLIVVDTLRADHLGAYGYEYPTSPNIDRLAANGVLFTRASAPSSWTRPSIASLFTSRTPSEHGAVSFDRGLDSDLPTLAQELRQAGYRTLGVTGNFVHVNAETGLSRGFDEFESMSISLVDEPGDAIMRLPVGGQRVIELRAPTAVEVNREVLARLPSAGGTPFFFYIHYMDPHAVYLPPERFRRAFSTGDGSHVSLGTTSDDLVELAASGRALEPGDLRRLVALYDAEIASVDHEIGRLVETLEQRGLAENLVIVVVSDHGEEFGEHGGWFHGVTLYEESISVPLIVYDSRRERPAIRREEPVDLLDVPTTLLALAGVEPPPGMQGRDLLQSDPLPRRDLLAELHPDPPFETNVRPRAQSLALARWPWKLILMRDGGRQLYRLDRDPGEAEPLADPRTAPDDLSRAAELAWTAAAAAEAGRKIDLDPEHLKGLRALGYAE